MVFTSGFVFKERQKLDEKTRKSLFDAIERIVLAENYNRPKGGRVEICNICKHGGFGVDDLCDLGKDQTDYECPFFEHAY